MQTNLLKIVEELYHWRSVSKFLFAYMIILFSWQLCFNTTIFEDKI